MDGDVFMRAYYNGEIISHTVDGVKFVCQNPLSSVIPYTMTFVDIQSHISKRVSNILFRNPVVVFGGAVQFLIMRIYDDANMHQMFQIYQHTRYQLPILKLYVKFEVVEHQEEMEEEQNILGLSGLENDLDTEDEFEKNYEFSDDNEDGDNVDDPFVHEVMQTFIRNDSFGIPSMMRALNLDAMNPRAFPEYATIGVAAP
ncbi:hypothetical protein PIB30_042034 [Stylosanthes scabra]|uniref:Uncharacterized protein n=1 Tax=Stylosanthes scabra TaxID=79078 RepID=A0ABU6VF59_9FABA|nr:hypothetical protein [Stylosanthes scabra]